MIDNLAAIVLASGGDIYPLIIPSELTGGTGVANPSIFAFEDKALLVNIRHVGYSLYFAENQQRFQTRWGFDYSPFCYLHPEDDCKLRTVNYLCHLNPETKEIEQYSKVATETLDKPPVWEFIGLEDARVVMWEGALYLCGVRRDTKPNGEGRMELSKIEGFDEVSRVRIDPPNDPNSYCEKNWMPIFDMPFHFVKWCNPTEIVKVDPATGRSETVHLANKTIPLPRDLRGGSQVLTIGQYYVAITHEVDLWKTHHNKKNGRYYHRFVVWDKDFNIVKVTEEFNFMGAGVEFCCGFVSFRGDFYISFAYQDNASFLLKVPKTYLLNFLGI